MIPARPVTEGQSVTLSCLLFQGRILDSNFSFYKNDELLQSDFRRKLEISAVSKSDEGLYKCEHSGDSSPESWMSVRCECDQHEVEQESPGWEVHSNLFCSVFSLRRLLNTRSTWSIHVSNFYTCFYTYTKYFYNYKPFLLIFKYLFKQKKLIHTVVFLHVKMSAEVLVLYFSTSWICLCSSLLLTAPHCSSLLLVWSRYSCSTSLYVSCAAGHWAGWWHHTDSPPLAAPVVLVQELKEWELLLFISFQSNLFQTIVTIFMEVEK